MMKITTEIMEYGYAFLYERYQLPLYVTECGLSCNDHIFLDGQVHDADRIDFLHRYLLALYRGCERADIRGFFHWSLTDNFEWHSGYAERFGLIYVDYPTQKRILKDSARWYAQTVRENGKNLQRKRTETYKCPAIRMERGALVLVSYILSGAEKPSRSMHVSRTPRVRSISAA